MEEANSKIENEVGYIKLMKNGTSKGLVYYNWEIKAYCNSDADQMKKLADAVEWLNGLLVSKFPGELGDG